MVEKTLSTSTLNMRFMQNARRALQLPTVEPEHAHVKDNAEWEVAQDIRQAWAQSDSEKPVTYETSYLPFLFPSLHDTPPTDGPSSLSPSNTLRPRGRRVFNKRGEEITREPPSLKTDAAHPENMVQGASEHTKRTRPQSISSASLTTRRPTTRDPSKDAKNVVFDMTGVGTDLRQSSSTQAVSFLRPSGVDEPADPPKPSDSTKAGTRGATDAKVKRSRTSGEVDKTQKKTRLTRIE